MGCTSCGTSSSGSCTTGCGKLDIHDWLGNMSRPLSPFDAVEVRFKGGRKEIFRNTHNLEVYTGDVVVVEAQSGHHMGEITMQGELVRLQLKKKKIKYNDDLPVIYRKASEKDVEKFEQARNRELPTLYRSREIIQDQQLGMKLSDVEYQADNTKATFFYSAEDRVDFRELIKVLASEFKIRVEMKQISLRQEASRLGGIGSCGRELCCSTWLTDFKNVSTSAARYQNLSLNPAKLSGQCGRLKCCLNYELDTYLQVIKEIPKADKPLKTEMGLAFHQKTDIFKKMMWFSYEGDNNWVALKADRVKEIIEINKKGEKVYSLEINEEELIIETTINSDLLELDRKLQKKQPSKQRNKRNRNKGSNNTPQEPRNKRPNNKKNKPEREQKENKPNNQKKNRPRAKKTVDTKVSQTKNTNTTDNAKKEQRTNRPKRQNVTQNKKANNKKDEGNK